MLKIIRQSGHEEVKIPNSNGATYTRPIRAVGECPCGDTVELDGFTNTCDTCGRDYNMSGQELAPRRFWGEECNETASDILTSSW